MPRPKQFGKRKCHPNQFSKRKNFDNVAADELEISASKQKILSDQLSDDEECYNGGFFSECKSKNIIIDLNMLIVLLNAVSNCKHCNSSNCFDVIENESSRKGLAVNISAICKVCGCGSSTMSSNISDVGYDINVRLVYSMRCIGKGKCAARTFCAMMNLPPPPSKFERYSAQISNALHKVSLNSMQKSIEETVSSYENSRDISVALDGSWQKRGHTSLNGVITATSLENGKVIDFECLTKYCFKCRNKDDNCEDCQINYSGFSAGMESEGALRIFQRSLNSRNVRYLKYLGDGDSKGFLRIQESKVYGEGISVEKLECLGHVQKRMGARLRALRNNMKSTKLSDGKKISGRGRLTDAEILLLQKYYGLAIRRNIGKSVEDMSRSIWAIYFHKLSTDKKPQHGLCPMGADSWCGYNRSLETGEKYTHKHSLPEPVLIAIKKVFRDLSSRELLLKCLHGRTQNPNESFNNCVWERVPKNTFVSKETLQTGVMDAIICFNDGVFSRTKVLKALKINPGSNTCTALRKIDRIRICESEIIIHKVSKEARTLNRQKKRQRDAVEESIQDQYSAGNF